MYKGRKCVKVLNYKTVNMMKKNYIEPKTEMISVAMTNTLCASGKTVTFGSGKASGEGL